MANGWLGDILGYKDALDNGTDVPRRSKINFIGDGVTVVDNPTTESTDVTIDGGVGSGDVVGPASATDNAIARFNLTTGKLVQNSAVTIDDSGNVVTAGVISSIGRLSTTLAANPGTTNGQVVVITGRSDVGDGAEGFAIWRSTSTATADNATVWGSGTGRWHRVRDKNDYHVAWFGAKGDNGVTDDTAAIQACIDAAIVTAGTNYTTMGCRVLFDPSVYRITSITWSNVNGLVLSGSGQGSTVLMYTGTTNATLDLISFDGINCRIENLTIRTSGYTVRSAITCTSGTAGGWISSNNVFSDIVIGGYILDQFQYGMRIVQGSAGDSNNELHRFLSVSVTAYTDYAFYIDGGQAHALWFEGCQMMGNGATGGALGGVYCYYGSYIHWNGGSGGYHIGPDFYFNNFFQHSSVRGWNSENSYRLCLAGNATAAPFPLEISNCRFNSALVPADEEVIRVRTSGPTTIRANVFDVTSPVSELVTLANDVRTQYIAHRADDTVHDVVGSADTIAASACTNLATAITLLNQIRTAYAGHRVDLGPHDNADNTNTVASGACTDQPTATTLALQLKTALNAHRTQATVHPANDVTNVVTSECLGRRAFIRNDGYSDTQTLTVEGNSFVSDTDYDYSLTSRVESGDTYYRRGAVKGQNPSLWRIVDGGNLYYESSVATGVHRVFPSAFGLRGLSSTGTTPNNLGGTALFVNGDTSKTVTFGAAEPDSSYGVVATIEITGGSPTARTVYVSSKGTSGFTLTLDAALTAGQTISIHWIICRS